MKQTAQPRAKRTLTAREVVRRIMILMTRKQWKRGESAKECAKEWGMTVSLVEHYAAEASRHLDLIGDREALLQTSVGELLRIVDESGSDRVPAIKLALESMGLLKQRHEVEVHEVDKMPKEEVFANALKHPGFREWLIEQGWKEPA